MMRWPSRNGRFKARKNWWPPKITNGKRIKWGAKGPNYRHYVAYAYPPGGVHRAVPRNQNRQAALRRPMAARNQARWLPHHCPQERRAGEALGDGPTVFAHACKMGLEGIVSKRKDSAYRSGRSPDCLKMKNPDAPAVTREAEEDWVR